MPVDDRQIHPLGLAPLELLAQQPLRPRILREDDQPGRVAIDAVHDERPAFAGAQVFREQFVDRRRVLSPLERHREQARRFVDDHQHIVFVDDLEVLRAANRRGARGPFRAAGAIHPHADGVAFRSAATAPCDGVASSPLRNTLPRSSRGGRASPREPRRSGRRQKLVEPRSRPRQGRRSTVNRSSRLSCGNRGCVCISTIVEIAGLVLIVRDGEMRPRDRGDTNAYNASGNRHDGRRGLADNVYPCDWRGAPDDHASR